MTLVAICGIEKLEFNHMPIVTAPQNGRRQKKMRNVFFLKGFAKHKTLTN